MNSKKCYAFCKECGKKIIISKPRNMEHRGFITYVCPNCQDSNLFINYKVLLKRNIKGITSNIQSKLVGI